MILGSCFELRYSFFAIYPNPSLMNNVCMIFTQSLALEILSILVFGSIIFVWGIRYNNIKDEFKHFQLPNWLRDLVGILKLSFAIMLFSENLEIIQIGASGIALLMVAALLTHLRLKSESFRMLPSFALLCACLAIIYMSNQILTSPA